MKPSASEDRKRLVSGNRSISANEMLWLSTALLLLFFATRVHGLLAIPVFVDEGTHITWAQHVFQGQPLEAVLSAKMMLIFSLSLFDPSNNGLFIGRFLVILTGLIGIAAIIGSCRLLKSKGTGLIAGTLWLLCPYLFFFERLALADAMLAASVTVTAWALIRLSKAETVGAAILTGVALALCPLAKTPGFMFAELPIFMVFLKNGRSVWHHSRTVIIVYAIFIAIVAIPIMLVVWGNTQYLPGTVPKPIIETSLNGAKILLNSALTIDAFCSYFTVPFLVLLISMALFGWQRGWPLRFIPIMILGLPLILQIPLAIQLFLRYLVIAVPGLLMLSALGMSDLLQILATKRQQLIRWRVAAFLVLTIGVWLGTFVGPFMIKAYSAPSTLPLPYADKGEYITDWPSGFGVRDAANALLKLAQDSGQSIVAVGMIGNCRAIPLSLPANAPASILCPIVNDTISRSIVQVLNFIRAQINKNGSVLVFTEQYGPYATEPLPPTSKLLAIYPRPDGDHAAIELFRVFSTWPTF